MTRAAVGVSSRTFGSSCWPPMSRRVADLVCVRLASELDEPELSPESDSVSSRPDGGDLLAICGPRRKSPPSGRRLTSNDLALWTLHRGLTSNDLALCTLHRAFAPVLGGGGGGELGYPPYATRQSLPALSTHVSTYSRSSS